VDVPVDENGKRRAGVKAETLDGFVGKDVAAQIEKKYDPAKNPFRNPKAAVTAPVSGSYDDDPDAAPVDDVMDDMADIQDPDAMGGEMDVEDGNGQI
jgi:hypothetical protein